MISHGYQIVPSLSQAVYDIVMLTEVRGKEMDKTRVVVHSVVNWEAGCNTQCRYASIMLRIGSPTGVL